MQLFVDSNFFYVSQYYIIIIGEHFQTSLTGTTQLEIGWLDGREVVE